MVDFWNSLDKLIVKSRVVIDRPQGSAHPRYPDMIYPLDYGYLNDTTSTDQSGIDVWVGGSHRRQANGIVCIVDAGKGEVELKVLLGCNDQEIDTVMVFLEQNGLSPLLVRRYG